MTLVVPFDGSDLSKAALVRAAQFDTVLDEGVVAVTVVPSNNRDYATEHGWIAADEEFDREAIVDRLVDAAGTVAPDAAFEALSVDRWAPRGTIAKELRSFARDADASIVFVGSDNAGRVVRSMSVGSTVATDRAYDTLIVSSVAPTRIAEFEAAIPTEQTVE